MAALNGKVGASPAMTVALLVVTRSAANGACAIPSTG
jgi:hypothetical protein